MITEDLGMFFSIDALKGACTLQLERLRYCRRAAVVLGKAFIDLEPFYWIMD
jgi:hypothetical protein